MSKRVGDEYVSALVGGRAKNDSDWDSFVSKESDIGKPPHFHPFYKT